MMTLPQAERLVRKIDELIGQPGLEAQGAKLAQEFAELGRAASRRLEQCVAMIENGQDLQALQLAETPPPLLDILTLLDFRHAKEWRAWCQRQNLPWIEPFSEKHVRALNAAYGKGISGDSEAIRDYRRELLKGNEAGAISVLRLIVRLNPGDKNWAQELKRLENKQVQAQMDELRGLLAAHDNTATLARLAQLETSALPIPTNHPAWRQAQVIRCQSLLEKAELLRAEDDWQATAGVIEEIRLLANQNELPLSEADTQRWNELEAWASNRREELARDQQRQAAANALLYQLDLSEHAAAAKLRKIEQLQQDLRALEAKWHAVEGIGQPIDDESARRYRTVRAALAARIQRQLKELRTSKILIAAGIIVFLSVIAFLLWGFERQKLAAAQLNRLVAERRVGETQQLLDALGKSYPQSSKPAAFLNDAVSKAEQFIGHERELKQVFDQKMTALQDIARAGFTNSLNQIDRQRSDCEQSIPELAPEFRAESEGKLAEFDKPWNAHLDSVRPKYYADFEGRLASAERSIRLDAVFVNRHPPFSFSAQELETDLGHLNSFLSTAIPLPPALAARYQDLTNQLTHGMPALRHLPEARDLADYFRTLQTLAQSHLLRAPQGAGLESVLALNHDPADIMGALLLPEQPQLWPSLAQGAASFYKLRPDQPNDAEKEIYLKLAGDKNVQEIYAYRLEKNNRPDNRLETHTVFSQGRLATNRLGAISGVIYDPLQYPRELTWERRTFDTWDYTNVAALGLIKEARAFHDLGIDNFIDPNTGNYTVPILQALDGLARRADASAIYRAFVSVKLFSIAGQRPMEWGLGWAPGAAARIQELKNLGAADIQSGDWLVPERYSVYENRLKDQFDRAGADSLEEQAQFFKTLAQRASAAGFAYAGFADANGAQVPNAENSSALECWGWSAQSASPRLLLQRANADQPWKTLAAPRPFSPLLVFREDRRALLKRVSQSTLYPLSNAAPYLPPLFAGAYE